MLVHAVFEVPDDTVIDPRPVSEVKYLTINEDKVEPKVASATVTPILSDLSSVSVEKIQPKEGDVIFFRYSSADVTPEDAIQIRDVLKSEFPNNKVLGLTSDVQLLCENREEAIDMLNRMIAHIKIVS